MAVYYLSPDGRDGNDGSESAPWATITHAADRVSAGDTIYMKDGVYDYGNDVQRIDGTDGTSSTPITLTAADGASPELVWSGNAAGWRTPTTEGILVEYADNWIIEGLTVRDSEAWGIHIRNSDNITVRNVEAYNNAGPGIGVAYEGSDLLFEGCQIHHNGVEGATTGDGDGLIVNGASGDVSGTVIRNCQIWSNTDDGVDLWDGRGISVYDSQSWDNGRSGSPNDGSGMGFKLGGGSNSGDNHIQRSAAWRNEYAGIADNLAGGTVRIWNCTSWDNPRNYELSDGNDEIINCISHDGAENISSGTTQRANSWNLGISQFQFQSLDPSADGFLRLGPDSPAIDAGVDVGVDYTGSAPDLGAYETGTSELSSGPTLFYHDGTEWRQITT